MEKVVEILKLVLEKGPEVAGYVVAVLGGLISISLLIPGDQPEKSLQKVVDFISKFSKK